MFKSKKDLKKKHVESIIMEEASKFYDNVGNLYVGSKKMYYISMISTISESLINFFVDLSKSSNFFYNSISKVDEELISVMFSRVAVYISLNAVLEGGNADDCKNIEEEISSVFSVRIVEKYYIRKYFSHISEKQYDFYFEFVNQLVKKVFNTKCESAMEFAYINFFLVNTYHDFEKDYLNSGQTIETA